MGEQTKPFQPVFNRLRTRIVDFGLGFRHPGPAVKQAAGPRTSFTNKILEDRKAHGGRNTQCKARRKRDREGFAGRASALDVSRLTDVEIRDGRRRRGAGGSSVATGITRFGGKRRPGDGDHGGHGGLRAKPWGASNDTDQADARPRSAADLGRALTQADDCGGR